MFTMEKCQNPVQHTVSVLPGNDAGSNKAMQIWSIEYQQKFTGNLNF